MLIYDFSGRGTHPLYEYLYHCLKADILNGRIPAGTKLPSKRELAADNQISVRTVMNAYEQLLTEGYITSEEKRGYFAAKLETAPERSSISACSVSAPERTADRNFASEDPEPLYKEDTWYADFTSNNTIYEKFPFSLWRKTMREVLSEYDLELVQRAHFLGVPALRKAIADYLYRSRGMNVSPECIVIGAGIEYLYEKLIKLLPGTPFMARKIPDTGRFRVFTRNSDFHGKALKWMNPASAWPACGKAAQMLSMFPRSTTIRSGLSQPPGGARSCFPGQQRPRTAISSRMIMTASFATPPRAFLPCRAWI